MHPLSLLPQLFTYSLIAPFLLRITVGSFLIVGAWARYKKAYKWSFLLYTLSGVFLILGLYTQLSAILGIIVVIWDACIEMKGGQFSWEQRMLRKLILIVLISLLLTGPGAWAMDLPL